MAVATHTEETNQKASLLRPDLTSETGHPPAGIVPTCLPQLTAGGPVAWQSTRLSHQCEGPPVMLARPAEAQMPVINCVLQIRD
ncbi:hypothetical protein MHYP_G00203970 [Metynnis hypsauchen]